MAHHTVVALLPHMPDCLACETTISRCVRLFKTTEPPTAIHLIAAPRYYGTVFCILLTILGFGGMITYLAYTCYTDFKAPNDRYNHWHVRLHTCQHPYVVVRSLSRPENPQ